MNSVKTNNSSNISAESHDNSVETNNSSNISVETHDGSNISVETHDDLLINLFAILFAIAFLYFLYKFLKKRNITSTESIDNINTVQKKSVVERLNELLIKNGLIPSNEDISYIYQKGKESITEKILNIIKSNKTLEEKRKEIINLYKNAPENLQERNKIKSLYIPKDILSDIRKEGFPLVIQEELIKMNYLPETIKDNPEKGIKEALLFSFDKGVDNIKSIINVYIELLEKDNDEDRLKNHLEEIEERLINSKSW